MGKGEDRFRVRRMETNGLAQLSMAFRLSFNA